MITKQYLDNLCKDTPDWKGWTGQDWADFWYNNMNIPKLQLSDLFDLCIRINYERGKNKK